MTEQDPHGAILRAARWAELNHKLPTWKVLYDLAGEVAVGLLDVADMPPIPDEGEQAWLTLHRYLLERHKIDQIARAYDHVPPPTPEQIEQTRPKIEAVGRELRALRGREPPPKR